MFAISVLVCLALTGPLGLDSAAGSTASPTARYIVTLKGQTNALAAANNDRERFGIPIHRIFHNAVHGYTTSLTPKQARAVANDSSVQSVERDSVVTAAGQTLPFGVNRIDADLSSTKAGNGSGAVGLVNVYVIDSGVSSHPDLNVVAHRNWTGDGKNYDCAGHGTHVAGIIGAKDNSSYVVGVAPDVAITDLKVLGCNATGATSNVIAAVDWVTANAKKPAVVNMSLSGPPSPALDSAVERAAAGGVLVVVAAGNNGADACNYSPARAGATDNGIITVGATDAANAEASFSNYGHCVDLWAPGVSIVSTSNAGGTVAMSGTSMAAPHVAGAVALYLSRYKTTYMPSVEGVMTKHVISTGKLSKDDKAIKIVSARGY